MTQQSLFDQEPTQIGDVLVATLQQYVPARARRTDPQTSLDAAANWTKEKLTHTQMIVLSFFLVNRRGTDGDLERWAERTYPNERFGPSSLRKRRGDLVEKQILQDSGKTDEERHMKIWELRA